MMKSSNALQNNFEDPQSGTRYSDTAYVPVDGTSDENAIPFHVGELNR